MTAKLSIDFAEEQVQGYERVFAKRPLLTNLSMNWNGINFTNVGCELLKMTA